MDNFVLTLRATFICFCNYFQFQLIGGYSYKIILTMQIETKQIWLLSWKEIDFLLSLLEDVSYIRRTFHVLTFPILHCESEGSRIETQVNFLLSFNLVSRAKGWNYGACSLIWIAQCMVSKEYMKQENNFVQNPVWGFQVGKNWLADRIWQKAIIPFSSVNVDLVWEYAAYWRINLQPVKGLFKTSWWFQSIIQKDKWFKAF